MVSHKNHHISDLKVHLVFVVKYRRKLITPCILKALITSFKESCERLGCQLLESNGEEDHMHLLVEYPTTVSIANLVHQLKGASSSLVRKYPSVAAQHWMHSFWSEGYYAVSCGGATLEMIKRYIENQGRLISPG